MGVAYATRQWVKRFANQSLLNSGLSLSSLQLISVYFRGKRFGSRLQRGGVGMAFQSRSLALAGIFLSISAALHVTSIIVGGLHISTLVLLVFGVVYFGWARGFLAGSDLWDKPVVAIMLLGILGALFLPFAAPHWWLRLIVWADAAVILFLIIYILRR